MLLPFPHTDSFNPADGLPDPPDEEDFGSEEKFCHLGCAYREALVVSGPARGQMWADDTAGDGGFRPIREADGSPTRFGRWYRGWLERAEEQARSGSG